MSLFPLISEPAVSGGTNTLPMYQEVDWDFKHNKPVWRGGNPVYVTGARAVLVWAWNALHTIRFAHDVFSVDYGIDTHVLISKPYTEEVRQAEAIRIVRETLLVNPYITAVHQIGCRFEGSVLYISFKMTTVYGEVTQDEFGI